MSSDLSLDNLNLSKKPIKRRYYHLVIEILKTRQRDTHRDARKESFRMKFNLRKFMRNPYFTGVSWLFVANLLQNREN